MKNLSTALILLVLPLLCACEVGGSKEVDEENAKYTTSDASELFFKNIRSIYYDKTVMDEAKLDVYRIKERPQTEEYPLLNLSIVVNWRFDEAYILTEPNDYLQQMDTIEVLWQDTINNEQDTIQFTSGNKDAHFRFAAQIYRNIQSERPMYVLNEMGEKLRFMNQADAKEAFRKTMVDYFRLVDLL